MNIPDSIKVGGHTIKIELTDTARINGKGEFSNYHNLIRLTKEDDIPDSNLSECFLHEIFEVIKIKNNLKIDHTHLTVLSECLYQVLKDNKLTF